MSDTVETRKFVPNHLSGLRWELPDRYSDLKPVGAGAFGVVCSATDNALGGRVAIKRVDKPFDAIESAKRTYRELTIMAHMNHENVITLIDAFTPQKTLESFNEIFFVMPFMEANLFDVLKSQILDDNQIVFLVYQIMRALKYMHGANIIHRDLKPQNIAVDRNCNLRIIDFDLARQIDEDMSSYVVTRWYRAPEIIAMWVNYTDTVDIWSVACILVEMKTRRPLFSAPNALAQLQEIFKLVGLPDEEFRRQINSDNALKFIDSLNLPPRRDFKEVFPWASDSLCDLLSKILVLDPHRRLNAANALAHPYFAEYHDENDEPTGERPEDDLMSAHSLTVDGWKEATWNFLKNFKPKILAQMISVCDVE